MRTFLILIAAMIVVIGVSILAYGDAGTECAKNCVETCSAGPSEDYVTCLNNCLAGCPLPDAPPEPSPVPVPEPSPTPSEE